MKRWTSWIVALLMMQWLISCSGSELTQETLEPTPLNPQAILQNSLGLLKTTSLDITLNYTKGVDFSDRFDHKFQVDCKVDIEATQSYCILNQLTDAGVVTELVWQKESVWMRQGGPWRQADENDSWRSSFLPGMIQLNGMGQIEERFSEFIQLAEVEERQTLAGKTVYEITAVVDAKQYYIDIHVGDEELGQAIIDQMNEQDSIEVSATFIIDSETGQMLQATEVQRYSINDIITTSTIQHTFVQLSDSIDISEPPQQD